LNGTNQSIGYFGLANVRSTTIEVISAKPSTLMQTAVHPVVPKTAVSPCDLMQRFSDGRKQDSPRRVRKSVRLTMG
jgi:hypothetical protein